MLNSRLRELRKRKELSQESLANLLGVSQSAITSYENGKNIPSPDVLKQIAKLFDVSIDYLLGNSDIKANFDENETDLMKIVNLYRPKLNGVEVNDAQWDMITLFLKSVVEQLRAEGKIPM
jgi:transcriptional regulator with XRE-family HTH domain